jgi:cytochrome c oxidase cbb3-type subunit III
MHKWRVSRAAARIAFVALAVVCLTAQDVPPAPGGGRRGGRGGGFNAVAGRPAGDPAEITRGKTLYGVQCTGCHGADLRGGDMGGPNLLRSQAILSDGNGENILPILENGRPALGMPSFASNSEADRKAIAAYLRSVAASIGRQGMPPEVGVPAGSILVGDAKAGQVYFDSKCAACHSAIGDLKGLAARIADPKVLQDTWVGGGRGGRRGGDAEPSPRHTVTASVTLPSGQVVSGKVVQVDDFLVSFELDDGTLRSFRRDGAQPQVEIHDPMQAHREMLAAYSDKDMHDVTAYLATLK